MKKTMVSAFIEDIDPRFTAHPKICRRIWEDENGEWFIKVNGNLVPLVYYQRSKDYSVSVG